MLCRPNSVHQFRESNPDLPTYVFPIAALGAELRWLRALPTMRLDDTNRDDSRVGKREENSSGS